MKRSRLPAFLRTFDSPDYVSGLAKRPVTTTAPQALVMMNAPAVREWARRFAARLATHQPLLPAAPGESPAPLAPSAAPDPTDVTAIIAAAYSAAVGRGPSDVELQDARSFIDSQAAAHAAAGRQDAVVAARIDFCQVLLGLNETLHIE
jgi:hypothetical protein